MTNQTTASYLIAKLKPMKSPANMRDIFIDLMGYARTHFWTEEELMFKFKFEGYEKHKKAHWEFTKSMINLSFDYVEGVPDVDERTIAFLETWLIEHVVDEDIKFVKLFKENGVE